MYMCVAGHVLARVPGRVVLSVCVLCRVSVHVHVSSVSLRSVAVAICLFVTVQVAVSVSVSRPDRVRGRV